MKRFWISGAAAALVLGGLWLATPSQADAGFPRYYRGNPGFSLYIGSGGGFGGLAPYGINRGFYRSPVPRIYDRGSFYRGPRYYRGGRRICY